MKDPPKDPRVVAMMAALFGREWETLEGEVAFEKTPVETWVVAVETMLGAADGTDPLRVALRHLMQEESASDRSAEMPSRTEG